MVKKILFDVDNTLLDFRKCAKDSMRKAFDKWGIKYKEEYFPVFMKMNDKYWTMLEDGLITREQLYAQRWVAIFKELGIEADGEAFERDFVANLYESHVPVDGAASILEYLGDKYDLYVASNSSYNEQLTRLRKAGMMDHLKEIYTSEEIGAAKPSKEFFDYILDQIGMDMDRDEVLIIGDSLNADIRGGKRNGLKTCWLNLNKSNEKPEEADYIIESLDEIRDIL